MIGKDDEPNRQGTVGGVRAASSASSFWEGASVLFKPRIYGFYRDREGAPEMAALAIGGGVEIRSGWAAERIQLGAVIYGSQRIIGASDKDGTQLLKPGQESFSVLGEANLTFRMHGDNLLRIGRQSFDLPYLSRHDIRMVPNTFEGVVVGRDAKDGLSYIAGYVSKIKRKNDDRFIPLSQAAGANRGEDGMILAGLQQVFPNGSVIGAIGERTFDVMDTWHAKGQLIHGVNDMLSLRLSGQVTRQKSSGHALIGDFSTHLHAAMLEAVVPRGSLRVAASRAGRNKGIQTPYGGSPNYLAIIVENFDRAGERALMIGASRSFSSDPSQGLSMFVNHAKGRTPGSGWKLDPDQSESDVTLDYRTPKNGQRSGLWFRARVAYINQRASQGGRDFVDARFIVNYEW